MAVGQKAMRVSVVIYCCLLLNCLPEYSLGLEL